jgi:hypothetical protein
MYLLYKEKINAKKVAYGHQTFSISPKAHQISLKWESFPKESFKIK